jgi:hypothetical protein
MHRHECNTHNFLFNLENQTKDFSYTTFPVKKINVGKILKLWENCYLIILSIHILKLEISGCDTRRLGNQRRAKEVAEWAKMGPGWSAQAGRPSPFWGPVTPLN